MREHGFVEGTNGITYLHKTDKRRHRKHCVHYRKDGSCAYMSRCGGSAQCQYYGEEEYTIEKTKIDQNIIKNELGFDIIVSSKKSEEIKFFSGVQTIKLNDIIVPDKFLQHVPDSKKISELHDYYKKYKKLDKPICVSIKNGKYYLEDKYLRYYVAKELGKTWIRATIATYEESVMRDKLCKNGGRVKHKKYGQGTIVKNDDKYIIVLFDNGKEIKFDIEICIKNTIFS